ncbi:ATP-binding cassette domain-containing protein [Pseudomonas chlororaphis]|uniref:ATP-binding cassette domain-containing protein n=1 Tax=Pseudomonas chlororaphis TaxID=587753 RepID=UPI0015DE98DA|nr:ABC transporter ATP-binding protein [Pseudomonas chlororaphis]QLL12566.1 ABC transporter ATP-binding protein [Pseudomonas chlororaphis subsp. aurantiaca]
MNKPLLLTEQTGGAEPASRSPFDLDNRQPYAASVRLLRVTSGRFCLEVRDLYVRRARVTAIVGPNGAGKTTLIEALLGLRPALLEDAQLLGVPAAQFHSSIRHRQRLGVQLQGVEYTDASSVSEILALHRALYRQQDATVAEALGIDELGALPYSALSRGQKQRLDLFMALAHRPDIAVLDEPFTGLDRAFIERVMHLLRHELAGLTILMICHSAEELETASDVVWVCRGRVEFSGDKETLKSQLVGAFQAHLQLDNVAQLDTLYQQLKNDSATLRLVRPCDTQLRIYGTQQLDQSIRALVGKFAFRHFSFGPTHYLDMLYLCAQGRQDV